MTEPDESGTWHGRQRFPLKYYFAARQRFEVADGAADPPPFVGVATDGVGAGKKALQYTAVFNTSDGGEEAACWAPPQELQGSRHGQLVRAAHAARASGSPPALLRQGGGP